MATLSTLVVNLKANTAAYQSKMGKASRAMAGFRSTAARAGALLGAGLGLFRLGKFVLDTNRQFEKLTAQLETVQGSAAGASIAFKNIENLAASTPFQIEELSQAFITLRTLGVEPTNEEMSSLGDFASSMSRNITDVADAVRSAAGGMTLPLKLMGVEASIAGEQITLSYQGAAVTVGRSADEIVNALSSISQGNFAGAMAREMDTLNGIISNTQDAFGTIARTFGEVMLPVLKDVLVEFRDMASGLAENRGQVLAFGQIFVGVFQVIGSVIGNILQIYGKAFGNISALLVGLATFDFQLIRTALTEMKNDAVQDVGDIIRSFAGFFATLSTLGDIAPEIRSQGPAAGAAAAGVVGVVVNELTPLESAGVDAGRSLIRGFIDGTDSLAGLLQNAMRRIAEDLIIGTLETSLGIDSPSKVAAMIGQQTVAGFIGGVQGAASGVAPAVSSAFALPSGSGGGGGGTVTNVTNNYSINAMDASTFMQFARANKGIFAVATAEAARDAGGLQAFA